MNEVIQSLLTTANRCGCIRRSPSIRQHKQAILTAAMQAPTAGNQQMYTILDITDEQLKQQLAETCDHQPFIANRAAGADLLRRSAQMGGRLPVRRMLAPPHRPRRSDAFHAGCRDRRAKRRDRGLEPGIGSCYIGDIMENVEQHREMLRLPPQIMPATMVVFGYPGGRQLEHAKPPRSPLEETVQQNTYHRRDADALRRMIEPRIGNTAYDAWVAAFCERKFNSDFACELNRSARIYLQAYPPEEAQAE